MQLSNLMLLVVTYLTAICAARGGGGGGGRGSGGGGRGSSGRSSPGDSSNPGGGYSGGYYGGSSPGTYMRAGNNPDMTDNGNATTSRIGNYIFPVGSKTYPKGGFGGFTGNAPPVRYALSRNGKHYPLDGAYISSFVPSDPFKMRYGWVGEYNPSMIYWTLVPAWASLGFYETYHRFNYEQGAYFAPSITADPLDKPNSTFIINGTEGTNKANSYRYTFNLTTDYKYPMADHGFFASYYEETTPADFAFRLTFAHLVEFDDANHNGFYDENEAIISAISLGDGTWEDIVGSETNASIAHSDDPYSDKLLSYLVFSTRCQDLTRSNQRFGIGLTWSVSNVQTNLTSGIPIQPNSLRYNMTLSGYPLTPELQSGKHRLAVAQVLTLSSNMTVTKDINTTTPLEVAHQIKKNQTYGMSIGEYSEGRLEYGPVVNITEVTKPPSAAGIPDDTNAGKWIWREDIPQRQTRLFYVSILVQNTTGTIAFTGLGYLDVNVMSAMAAEYPALKEENSSSTTATHLIISITTQLLILCVLL